MNTQNELAEATALGLRARNALAALNQWPATEQDAPAEVSLTAAVDVARVFGAFHADYAEHERRAAAARLLADQLATAVHEAAEGGLDPAFMRRLFDLTMSTHNPDDDGPDDDAPAWTMDLAPDTFGDDDPPGYEALHPEDAEYDSYEADQDAAGHDGYFDLRQAA